MSRDRRHRQEKRLRLPVSKTETFGAPCLQAGALPVSQPPAPGLEPQSVMPRSRSSFAQIASFNSGGQRRVCGLKRFARGPTKSTASRRTTCRQTRYSDPSPKPSTKPGQVQSTGWVKLMYKLTQSGYDRHHSRKQRRPQLRKFPGVSAAWIATLMFMSVGCCATESVAVMGIGVGTCADFGGLYKLDPARAETMYFGWAQGFLSGWNIGRLADDQPFYNLKSIDADHQQWLIRKLRSTSSEQLS